MNRVKKSGEIEARLEASLRRQVTAPKLDGRFDAAVWARIAAQTQRDTTPVVARMPRWLIMSNVVGVTATVLLVVFYALRSTSGVELKELQLGADMLSLSAEQQSSLLKMAGEIVTGAALLFGLMFTRLGRRLRAALS